MIAISLKNQSSLEKSGAPKLAKLSLSMHAYIGK